MLLLFSTTCEYRQASVLAACGWLLLLVRGICFTSARLPPSLNSTLICRQQNGSQGTEEFTPRRSSHSKTCSRSAALDGEVAMYVSRVHIKAAQGGSFPALSFHSLHPFPPRLTVRWSAGVDRGVRPLISKHFQGVYGENATQYFLRYVVKITGKKPNQSQSQAAD